VQVEQHEQAEVTAATASKYDGTTPPSSVGSMPLQFTGSRSALKPSARMRAASAEVNDTRLMSGRRPSVNVSSKMPATRALSPCRSTVRPLESTSALHWTPSGDPVKGGLVQGPASTSGRVVELDASGFGASSLELFEHPSAARAINARVARSARAIDSLV
jgi:hypothetical protein